jgi:hypothetical protein
MPKNGEQTAILTFINSSNENNRAPRSIPAPNNEITNRFGWGNAAKATEANIPDSLSPGAFPWA